MNQSYGKRHQNSGTPSDSRLLSLEVAQLWRALSRQSPAFLFTLLYVFFEYVRPQSVYPALDILPYAQISLFGAVGFSLLEGRLNFSTASHLWGCIVLFSVVIVLSGLTAVYPSDAWDFKDIWINWILLMVVVGAGVRTRTEFLLLLVSFVLWNFKMSQFGARAWVGNGFSARAVGVSGGPGWFRNSGEFGIEMCIFLPIVGYFAFGTWPRLSKWKKLIAAGIVFSALISIIVGSSRGAFVGMMAIAVWILFRSPYRVRAALVSLPLAAAMWFLLPQRTKQRLSEAGEDKDSVARLTYWKHGIQITNEHPILGIGYNNWLRYYRTRYNPEGELPHNFLVECSTEMGYAGLLVFGGVMIAFFRLNADSRRRVSKEGPHPDRFLWAMGFGLDGAMVGFFTSGFFVSVLWYPFIWMNLALAMALANAVKHHSRSSHGELRQGHRYTSRLSMGVS